MARYAVVVPTEMLYLRARPLIDQLGARVFDRDTLARGQGVLVTVPR